jgi:PAS domain S-box-containing protein
VFIITSNEGISSSVQVFFIAASLAALTLFGYQRIWVAFVFVALSYVLFLIAYLVDLPLFGPVNFSPQYERTSTVINFTASLTACALAVYFILQNNFKSEKALRTNQAKLFRISEELRRSQERLETAIKGSRAGIYEWDIRSNQIEVSRDWKELLGYEPHEMNGLTAEHFVSMAHPEDSARLSESIQQHLKSGKPYRSELRLRTKSGEYKWVSDSGLCKVDGSGEPVMIVGSIVDISERKQAEKQIIQQNELLAKTNEELDRFVYSTSHDLRAPLSSMLGLISIAERTDSPVEVSQCLTMMRERVNTLDAFIREITDYSRNSRLEVALEAVPVASLVRGIFENLRYLKGADRIQIINEVPGDLLIQTDMGRLRVVISNLLANAFKYHDLTKHNPYIKVTCANSSGRFVLTVGDNGQGIDSGHQAKIFNMFYRASENSEGSGLGLYIVRETLDKLSGTISVQSIPGQGSVFTVTLPSR